MELRQSDGFTTDTIHTPLSVVHAHETGTRYERIVGKNVDSPIDTHWYWSTTMPATLTGARTGARIVFDFSHDRWRIENEDLKSPLRFITISQFVELLPSRAG